MLLWAWICAHAAPTVELPTGHEVARVPEVAVLLGDDPTWAEPDFDDSEAAVVGLGSFHFQGLPVEPVTWVRFTLTSPAEALEQPVLGIADPTDAASVFVDGQQVAQVGELAWLRRWDEAVVPIPADALADGSAVIALRVRSESVDSRFGGATGLLLVGEGPAVAGELERRRLRVDLAHRGELAGALAMVLVGGLFLFVAARSRDVLYLWFGASAALIGAARAPQALPALVARPPDDLIVLLDVAGLVSLMLFVLAFCGIRRPLVARGLPLMVVLGHLPFVLWPTRDTYPSYLFAGFATVAVGGLLVAHAAWRRVPDAWIMALAAPLIALGFVSPMLEMSPDVAQWLRLVAFAAAPVSMVSALANRHLRNHAAAARFVPHELISAFGWSEVGEVEGGSQLRATKTVLFTDIRGFTRLSESLEPDEVARTADAVLTLQADQIYACGGFVDKYIGDAVMALFDRPADALEAARRIRGELARWNEGRPTPVDVGIGIHTGPVVLGVVGSNNRLSCTVMGDTVNLASRVEGLTKELGRAVLLTAATRDAMPEVEGLVEVGETAVRGREGAVVLYGLEGGASRSAAG